MDPTPHGLRNQHHLVDKPTASTATEADAVVSHNPAMAHEEEVETREERKKHEDASFFDKCRVADSIRAKLDPENKKTAKKLHEEAVGLNYCSTLNLWPEAFSVSVMPPALRARVNVLSTARATAHLSLTHHIINTFMKLEAKGKGHLVSDFIAEYVDSENIITCRAFRKAVVEVLSAEAAPAPASDPRNQGKRYRRSLKNEENAASLFRGAVVQIVVDSEDYAYEAIATRDGDDDGLMDDEPATSKPKPKISKPSTPKKSKTTRSELQEFLIVNFPEDTALVEKCKIVVLVVKKASELIESNAVSDLARAIVSLGGVIMVQDTRAGYESNDLSFIPDYRVFNVHAYIGANKDTTTSLIVGTGRTIQKLSRCSTVEPPEKLPTAASNIQSTLMAAGLCYKSDHILAVLLE